MHLPPIGKGDDNSIYFCRCLMFMRGDLRKSQIYFENAKGAALIERQSRKSLAILPFFPASALRTSCPVIANSGTMFAHSELRPNFREPGMSLEALYWCGSIFLWSLFT